MKDYACSLISDFNIDNLAGYLNNGKISPAIRATVAPYGPIVQSLMNTNSAQKHQDFIVVWTQPQSVSKSFARALNFEKISHEQILQEVDEFCSLLTKTKLQVDYVLIPLWVIPTHHRGYGLVDLKDGLGLANILNKMNARLIENLTEHRHVFILNTQKWIEAAGKKAFSPKMWYMAKIAFGNEVFHDAACDIRSFCQTIAGQYRKLIVVDLDDTLWGGILGEEGRENLRLGGHDHIGEAFVGFQTALKALTNKGILLGIVSKNDEALALEAIDLHPEMVLKKNDFAGWRINWQDKAQNIIDLVLELYLRLQSVVFIDDIPTHRARVKEALPEVYVPEWPEDKMLYESTLLGLSCFDMPMISSEDLSRSRMYASERERKSLKFSRNSYEEWLKTLGIKVSVEEINSVNIQRTVQLLNKTNQMNLTTRRLSEEEFRRWAREPNHWARVIRVSDKFGDSGLTGIISLDIAGNKGRIIDFVLSCRVIGRKIEEMMTYILWRYCHESGLSELYADFIPTAKNQPCLDFWKGSGFAFNGEKNQFTWKVQKKYTLPSFIQLDMPSPDSGSGNAAKYAKGGIFSET